MGSITERRAELLVEFMEKTNTRNVLPNFRKLRTKYQAIEAEKTFTKDPFIDEVFDGRILRIIRKYFECYVNGYLGNEKKLQEIRVSELPTVKSLSIMGAGFGRVSRHKYSEILEKYSEVTKKA